MQHRFPSKRSTAMNIILGLIWILGLLLAGSDSPLMPWSNICGILLFAAACVCMAGKSSALGLKKRKKRFDRRMPVPGSSKGSRLQTGTSGA